MKSDKLLILQRIVGALYLFGGFAKPFPNLENVSQVLQNASNANAGTWLGTVSEWFATHSTIMIVVVGISMVSLGVLYLWDRQFIKLAVLGNFAMLVCFITILHGSYSSIWLIDGTAGIFAILIYYRQVKRESNIPSPINMKPLEHN